MYTSPSTIVSGLGLGKPAPSSEYSSNIIVKRFPLLGRLHFVKDRNGIMCLAFTFTYWVYGTWCGLWVVLLPHLRDGQASEPFVACKFQVFLSTPECIWDVIFPPFRGIPPIS